MSSPCGLHSGSTFRPGTPRAGLLALVLALAWACPAGRAGTDVAAEAGGSIRELFVPQATLNALPHSTPGAQGAGASNAWIKGHLGVRLGTDVLPETARPGDRWRLPLPDGGVGVVRVGRASRTEAGSLVVSGALEGEPGSEVRLAFSGTSVAGVIRGREGRVFRVEPRGGRGHRILEADPVEGPECGNPPGAGEGRALRELAAAGSAPAGTVRNTLDAVFLYTAAAEAGAGGAEGIRAWIALSVEESNDAYERSAAGIVLRPVVIARTEYGESGDLATDLGRLGGTTDPWLPEAHTLRESYAADVVCLVVEWEASNRFAGMANQLRETSASALSQGFTACLRPYLVGNYTLAHEVGHLLGCDHDRENSGGGALQSWSYGTRIQVDGETFRTVMAYRPGRQFPHFSNPDVRFRGVPTGVASGSGQANNARTMQFTGPLLSRVRDPASRIGFAEPRYEAVESAGTVNVRLVRSGTLGAGRVEVVTEAGSARDGIDFVGQTNPVVLNAGVASFDVALRLLDNRSADGTRRLSLRLRSPSAGLALGPVGVADVAVLDDEDAGAAPLDSSFRPRPGADHGVAVLAEDSEGRVLVGGSFGSINGEVRPRLGRFLADGTVDPGFVPDVKYPVHALARLPDGRIAIGGDFNTVNGERLNHVALLTPEGRLAPGFAFDAGTDLSVYALAWLSESRLLVGGAFSNVQGQAALRIACLGTNGSPVEDFTLRQGPDDTVLALVTDSQGGFLAGGRFRAVAGKALPGVARFFADGRPDPAFLEGGGTADGAVRALALDASGRVIVGGEFRQFLGRTRGGVARLTPEGFSDDGFGVGGGADGVVRGVWVAGDGGLWICGDFRNVDGVPRRGVARLRGDGSPDPGFDPGSGPDDRVLAMAGRAAGGVWIGGMFSEVNGVARAGVAALLPALPGPPTFTGIRNGTAGLVWTAELVPGQVYGLERSPDLEAWNETETVRSPDGRGTGTLAPGDGPSGYLRLRRKLE